MGKGDDPNALAGEPMPALALTDRQARKLAGLRNTHPGLIEQGLDEHGVVHLTAPGRFRVRRRSHQHGGWSPPIKKRILPDGQIIDG